MIFCPSTHLRQLTYLKLSLITKSWQYANYNLFRCQIYLRLGRDTFRRLPKISIRAHPSSPRFLPPLKKASWKWQSAVVLFQAIRSREPLFRARLATSFWCFSEHWAYVVLYRTKNFGSEDHMLVTLSLGKSLIYACIRTTYKSSSNRTTTNIALLGY